MSVDTIAQYFRGVKCRRCGKPVRLPALVARRESAAHDHHDGHEMEFQLVSQVFVLRCHSCRKESIYAINQIVDFAFAPPSDMGRAKEATV